MAKSNAQAVDDDILNPKVSTSCLDFLLIELVPLAQRITEQLHAREQALLDELRKSKIFNKENIDYDPKNKPALAPEPAPAGSDRIASSTKESSVTGTVSGIDPHLHLPSDSTREAVFWRLDRLGYRVGQGLAERFSINKPRPTSALDAIKFICKDLWPLLFRKPIDNLKTNHRGVFVLTDQRFPPISRMSLDRRGGARAAEEAMRKAQSFLYFPCGVIRGALAALGVEVVITGETVEIPTATFQIKTKGAKA